MRRTVTGEARGVNNPMETISAAATAIASAETRGPQAAVQKRRWGSCWSIYWCFGFHKPSKRIGHAVFVPETGVPGGDVPVAGNTNRAPAISLPFVAPPSSPVSFLQSEPPSATYSPAGSLTLASASPNIYSPGGRPSIFAIGPYAHETQLVSPPVFSTFTTEPSTAPFTPPPESVHMTTPSSPEVPFARLLDPNHQNGEAAPKFPSSHYEFQSYQLYPGSPVGHLISPSSGISGSGTSSPFPDRELVPVGQHFLEFRVGEPPKLLSLDKLSTHEWGSQRGSGSLTPNASEASSRHKFVLDYQLPEAVSLPNSERGCRNNEIVNHRVSFELTAEDTEDQCVEKVPEALFKAVSAPLENGTTGEEDEKSRELVEGYEGRMGETVDEMPEKAPAAEEEEEGEQRHRKHHSITLGSAKDFNFDNGEGHSEKPNIGPDWWANEKVVEEVAGPSKNWAFFPMMQPGVS
ncbi:uncharacterized protein LOC131164413 [Malania oleifera]|uniref:uncharacterized protein LOC131164413 n=1 Tax=Malania oleifera TaxID=397392 RepID=UPI0025AE6E85|nr:uncharacterized protein LOC131164413 [Malania oleifera]XP_057977561.1 uncharacterized protein LOC131164413 [Malania oleifera]